MLLKLLLNFENKRSRTPLFPKTNTYHTGVYIRGKYRYVMHSSIESTEEERGYANPQSASGVCPVKPWLGWLPVVMFLELAPISGLRDGCRHSSVTLAADSRSEVNVLNWRGGLSSVQCSGGGKRLLSIPVDELSVEYIRSASVSLDGPDDCVGIPRESRCTSARGIVGI